MLDPDRPLTPEEIEQAYKVEIVDKEGNKQTFQDLIKGKKVVLIFIRHFWCTNCQAYTFQFGKSIPPSSLPEGTEAYIIGCGSASPIPSYLSRTSSPYPIYSCPSLDLHRIFQFTRTLKGSGSNAKKTYMSELGGGFSRTWTSLKHGLLNSPGHGLESVRGPNDQNGGEVVIEKESFGEL
uniref:Thioredoxin domain-containing protein n=1 Tax=Kwoniella bestiolae CBS 10118 TaxID=1296100 RepID=A0A1B9FSM4_9TREE|nr:hypothetical protein I302_08544 [Kwoniella bestiolae CBS 10118]OCF21765.1 hypothetical protein I302_08544 [Kwoniella bestiolae CBS 10118]